MTRSSLPRALGLGLLLLTGCRAQDPAEAPAAPAPAKAPADAAAKLPVARMEVDIGLQSVALAEAEIHAQELSSAASAGRLRRELELATARSVQFKDVESLRRLKEAQMEVQRAQDQIDDNRDELQQLEKLYKGNDLADATKEIVLKRGRRALDRAAAVLAMKELQLKTLKDDLLPAELSRIQLEEDQKKDEIDRSSLAAENQLQQKRIALAKARVDLQKARNALADLEKK